ncbi:MAG: hypothetical protein CHACPFDD_04193 [Phycisphaerae bacterium]|nr:hypothetical protein [Phycisphaerae bacterium]
MRIIRRGFRGGKYIMEYDHPVVSLNKNGVVLHWQDPENFMVVLFDKGVSNVTPRLAKREGGDYTAISSGSAFSMSNGDRVRIVIQDDPGNSALQELQVDVNGTVRLTSTAIDDDWSAGSVGFYVKSGSGGTLSYDNFKVGYDNNADDDIDDAGDDIQIDDDFASSAMTLTYDDNGNLTDDGIFKFVYDAWNRLVKVQRRPEPTETKSLVATYAYDGTNRRTSKVVTNNGVEVYPNDGGETTVSFYYGGPQPRTPKASNGPIPLNWNIFETRNASNQTTWQYFWGTQYVDEIIFTDKNGDATIGNDCDPDGTSGEGSESPTDHRYFYHQDRNWNVVALTDYGSGVNGKIVERYSYTAYGEFRVLKGEVSGVESSAIVMGSSVGNIFAHQGLGYDRDQNNHHNRNRTYVYGIERLSARDPLEREGVPDSYLYLASNPTTHMDPSGLRILVPGSLRQDCLDVAASFNRTIGPHSQGDVFTCNNFPPFRVIITQVCPTQGADRSVCRLLDDATFDTRDITIIPVKSTNVVTDDYQTDQVDLDDIDDWPIQPPSGAPSHKTHGEIWAHVIAERLCLADGYSFDFCHNGDALDAQNAQRSSLGQPGRAVSSEFGDCNGQSCGITRYSNRARSWFIIPNGPPGHYEPPNAATQPTSTSPTSATRIGAP